MINCGHCNGQHGDMDSMEACVDANSAPYTVAEVEQTPWSQQDRIAAQYGVVETGAPVGADYHRDVDHDCRWTLSEVSERGGKIERVRVLHERGLFDISYIYAALPTGETVRVNMSGMESYAIPRRTFKGYLIAWAKDQGVYAKGMGLLDDSVYSILW